MKIWKDLSLAGRIVVGVWALALIGLIIFLVVRHNDDKKDTSSSDSNTPEVAQVYEPSIGTPLPADVQPNGSGTSVTAEVENSGEIAGATTTDPFVVPSPSPAPSTPEQIAASLVAPATGIDPNKPIPYENASLKFRATLPAGTQVTQNNSDVKFTTKSGALYYVVSVSDSGTETLKTIEAQLKNSPTVSNIVYGNFNNTQVLNFSAKGYGQGMVIIANGKIYYLLGNSQNFANFKI